VQLWNLKTEHGSNVLFSAREARVALIDLAPNRELDDHPLFERVVIQVLRGSIDLTAGETRTTCDAGALVALAPGEPHVVRALEQSRLLVTLAPGPEQRGHSPGAA
jgi:quercetin dioxygenase-like cupin family protein